MKNRIIFASGKKNCITPANLVSIWALKDHGLCIAHTHLPNRKLNINTFLLCCDTATQHCFKSMLVTYIMRRTLYGCIQHTLRGQNQSEMRNGAKQ